MDEELKEQLNDAVTMLKTEVTPERVGRKIIRFVAGHSVAFVASQIAKTYVPTENKKQELQVRAGAYVAGHMAGDIAADWAEQQVDGYIAVAKTVIAKVTKRKDEIEETSEETEPKLVPAE